MANENETVPGEEMTGLPSGQRVILQEVIWNDDGPRGRTARFRFIAPDIARQGGKIDFDMAAADMQALCEGFALSQIDGEDPPPAQIIISLSDRALPFGEADPDATQFFEAYRVEDGTCIWEMF
ncbi:MAG: DUF6497 family protein [Pseudorhodobacter sp.]